MQASVVAAAMVGGAAVCSTRSLVVAPDGTALVGVSLLRRAVLLGFTPCVGGLLRQSSSRLQSSVVYVHGSGEIPAWRRPALATATPEGTVTSMEALS